MSKSSGINQILATLSCNIISFSFGTGLAFASCSYPLWITDDTPLPSGKLTVFEASLVTSLMCIGCLVGNLFFISLSAKFGRKIPLLFLAIPQIVNFSLFYVATNVYYLYVARFLIGMVGGGAYLLVPLYVSEIADDNIRGMLGSVLTLSCNAGMTFGFVIGTYLEYFTQLKILILFPIAFLAAFNYFPETPDFLMQQQKKNMAEKSLSFFQGIKYVPNLKELDQEKQPMNADEKPTIADDVNAEKLSLSDFLTPAAKKAMTIGVIMTVCNLLSGSWPLMTYMQAIFEEAGATLSPNVCAIIVSLVQMTANIIAIILVDRIDRKKLYSISALCTGIGLAVLGLHSVYKDYLTEYPSMPLIAFSFIIFVSSGGMLPLHYVILLEIMPKRIQSVANLICMMVLWGLATIVLQIYPTISDTYGMHSCLFLFSASCCFLTIFTHVVIPETRGKSHETIMRALAKQK